MAAKAKIEMEVRARRGALYLDEYHPDWWGEIDLDKLDMADISHDVLGQLFSTYGQGCRYLKLHEPDREQRGFVLRHADIVAGWYPLLTDAWKGEVERRHSGCHPQAKSAVSG